MKKLNIFFAVIGLVVVLVVAGIGGYMIYDKYVNTSEPALTQDIEGDE